MPPQAFSYHTLEGGLPAEPAASGACWGWRSYLRGKRRPRKERGQTESVKDEFIERRQDTDFVNVNEIDLRFKFSREGDK